MTAGPWLLVNAFRTNLVTGALGNLTTSNAVKVALLTSGSNIGASSTVYSSLTDEVTSGNGYTTGGIACTLADAGTTSVTLTPTANIVWTASGGSIAAYFAVAYLATGGDILAYCELDATPATVTITSGNTLTIQDSAAIIDFA